MGIKQDEENLKIYKQDDQIKIEEPKSEICSRKDENINDQNINDQNINDLIHLKDLEHQKFGINHVQ